MHKSNFLLLFVFCAFSSLAQENPNSAFQQNIRGQVIDQQTGLPLIGANVVVEGTDPLKGSSSDLDGYYRIEGIGLGRYNVVCSYVGYGEQRFENVLLTTGKEVALNFEMLEGVTSEEEVVITAVREKDALDGGIATVSAKSINAEQSNRFSGTRGDVSRMVSSFAGVSANDDSRNDIVIRGNSPTGLLWRVNGIDIPNPSHFGALGATGGPVSMLNNNVLDKSLFLTGAFPANYGNALSGVFDISLKKGNRDKREYMAQIGFAGLEAGIEGPFVKGKNATYIANYRYSVLDILDKIGILDVGTGSGVPQYQDLTLNIDIPTSKVGKFSLFGIGGKSAIEFSPGEDSDAANLYAGDNVNLKYTTSMGVIGLSHKYYFNNKTFGNFSASVSNSLVRTKQDTISETGVLVNNFNDSSSISRMSFKYTINTKFNAKNSLNIGVTTTRISFSFLDNVRTSPTTFFSTRDFEGSSWLTQSFAQWQHRFTDRTTLNLGAYYQIFSLNESQALEPRISMRHELTPKLSVNLGAGRYSQMQPFQLYFVRTDLNDGSIAQTNRELKFSHSDQVALGLQWDFVKGWNLKAEGYFQSISNVPISNSNPFYSALNEGAEFLIPDMDSLVNEGTGKNIGVEFTLEKYFEKGFYLLSTLSLFDSKFKGSDGIEHSTAFDNGYIANWILGKEFVLNNKLSLSLDSKITTAGGRRHTPIDLERSKAAGETRSIQDNVFNKQYKDYFRMDIKISLRNNMKKFAQEWSLDMQNVFDTKNIFSQSYSPSSQSIRTTYQLGRYPVINYRLEF